MISLEILVAEILALFFLSRVLTISLSIVLQLLHFHQKLIVFFIAIIFFPGTLIHELSHWLMAKLLLVRTGKVSLFPQLIGNSITMGSVIIEKTDTIRSFMVGVAPLMTGIGIIFLTFYFLLPFINNLTNFEIALFIYCIFVVSNSMFSSAKDLEGGMIFIVFCFFFILFLFLFDQQLITQVYHYLSLIPQSALKSVTLFLSIPLVLDIIIVCVLRLFIRIFR